MRYPRLMMAALAAALLATTGCGRVAPTGTVSPVVNASGAAGKKLTGSATAKVTGGGLVAAGVGSVSGRVIDAAGRGVPGAVVVLDPTGTRLTTDATGAFSAKGLASGTYTFKAMISGMQQLSTNGVVVEANQNAQVPDISMMPGSGPSGVTSVTYVQETEMGRVGEPPATLVAPVGVAVRGGRDVLVLDQNHSAGVKTGIIRQYDGESGKFGGKYGDYTKWLGRNMMRDNVSAIALDNQGRSVVVTTDGHLWRFDPDGDKSFDKEISVGNAADVAVNTADGAIYVAGDTLTKFNAEGEGGQAVGEVSGVSAVAAYKSDVWVVTGNQVQKLSADGSMVLAFGAGGGDVKDSTFNDPTDVAVDPRNGNLVVVDKGTKNVYVYDSVGTLIGKVGQGVFDSPVAAAIDDTGRVYVVDAGKKKVYKFIPAGSR